MGWFNKTFHSAEPVTSLWRRLTQATAGFFFFLSFLCRINNSFQSSREASPDTSPLIKVWQFYKAQDWCLTDWEACPNYKSRRDDFLAHSWIRTFSFPLIIRPSHANTFQRFRDDAKPKTRLYFLFLFSLSLFIQGGIKIIRMTQYYTFATWRVIYIGARRVAVSVCWIVGLRRCYQSRKMLCSLEKRNKQKMAKAPPPILLDPLNKYSGSLLSLMQSTAVCACLK